MNSKSPLVACQLMPHLNERQQRLAAGAEAKQIGYGGISQVARATGLSRTTIHRGVKEIALQAQLSSDRSRRKGGGRKKIEVIDDTLLKDIERLIDPSKRGDPMNALHWTIKSTRTLAEELAKKGHVVSYSVVNRMLKHLGYSLQCNCKSIEEGGQHPDRNAQFEYINAQINKRIAQGLPVISVDAKKKELIGRYRNPGRTYRKKNDPEKVNVHDFPDPKQGKAIPYGIYDIGRNTGWVNVGCDHDTAAFAVASIRRWWKDMGSRFYPKARNLLICADSGGSNGYRLRRWKVELQKFVNDTRVQVTVCHLPPGTSKWNKIEHRLFSYISINWRGRPLTSHEVIVQLINATTTRTGLKVKAELDLNKYPTGVPVTKDDLAEVNLNPHKFHGEWNYGFGLA